MAGDQLRKPRDNREPLGSQLLVPATYAIAVYFSTKATLHDLDYTSQIAGDRVSLPQSRIFDIPSSFVIRASSS